MFTLYQNPVRLQKWNSEQTELKFWWGRDLYSDKINVWSQVPVWGFPGGASGKEPACLHRRHKRCRFDPWVRKIPWKREWPPTLVFLAGESHRQRSLPGNGGLAGLQSIGLQRVGHNWSDSARTHRSLYVLWKQFAVIENDKICSFRWGSRVGWETMCLELEQWEWKPYGEFTQ